MSAEPRANEKEVIIHWEWISKIVDQIVNASN